MASFRLLLLGSAGLALLIGGIAVGLSLARLTPAGQTGGPATEVVAHAAEPDNDHAHAPVNLPAYSPEEEIYVAKLRVLHRQVKQTTILVTGATLAHQSGSIDAAEYQRILQKARPLYRESQAAINRLDAPTSMAPVGSRYGEAIQDYLRALDLLERGATGDTQATTEAISVLQAGTAKALDITVTYWTDEYIPN